MKLRVWLYKIFLLLAAALLAFLLVSPRLQAAGPADEAPLSVETPEPEPESTPTPEPTPEPPPRYADREASMETPAGPLCINEIVMAGGDAVELRNLSDQPVQLSNYYLSDKNKNRLLLQLPEQMLEPGGLFVTEELSLSVKGERLWLSDADENVLDYANAAELPVGGSYGRMAGEDGWFYFASPSIGAENSQGWRRISETPAASIASGAYDGVQGGLSLELSGNGTIYYTLDGQAPSVGAQVYSGPILLEKTTVVRAMSVEDGALPSRVATYNYFINENHTLPIVCFSADDYDAWHSFFWSGSRFGEYAGTTAFYRDGEEVFNLACGLRLKGFSAVLDRMKKNFGVYFRGQYGDGDLENCDLFGTGVTEHGSLLIRAGQDHYEAIIRNELMQELCLQASSILPSQHNIYCVLYMNGRYMGIYSLKENMNDHFLADWYGVNADSVTTLRQRRDVEACKELQDIFSFCIHNDMANEGLYTQFGEMFDIDNFIDFILLEGFSGNTDLLENVRYFKSSEIDAKWRFAFFDLDCSFYNYYCGMRVVFEGYSKQNYDVTRMTRSLVKNPEFREKLLLRYAELLRGPLSPENVLREIELLCAEIEPEVARDRKHCGIDLDYWYYMVEKLKTFATDDYVRATIDTLREDLNISGEEMTRFFPEWA
ncbi:MAG: CotH kinase family protein [Oscillospiraceae bacterium]|nr:CotH kinase family protein [Oscillospiraceae bacterium]